MKKNIFFIIILSSLFSTLTFAVSDYWQQFVHYDYKVKLDVNDHSLSGYGNITYKNNSPDTLNRVYLHLYPNAFKDENSTMAQEAKALNYRQRITPYNNGYIDILEFRITRKDTSDTAENAPVSAYQIDDTILEAKLPEPLPPGEELQLYIKFYEKISSMVRRGGWRSNQYDLTQWYPKLVVYDQNGWHPDQYHLSGEFYGEFGTFDVEITLPYNYIVGATGVPVAGDPGWSWVEVDTSLSHEEWQHVYQKQLAEIEKRGIKNKERTVTFHAEKVHDFAWLASSDFLYERGEWNSIPVHVLYRKRAKSSWSKKVTQRGERVLEWLSTRFGMYPYPQLSITHGLLGGGMEYPMLVMNSSASEGLISHEVGHIYFYGILASDELAEAWMDEGFTTYQEGWYQEVVHGPWGYDAEPPDQSSWAFKLRPRMPEREGTISYLVDYLTSGNNEPLAQYAHKFKGGYGINAYTKGAAFFGMLHYVVGDSLWDEICHTYFDRWKFKHVNEARFKKVVEDVTGEEMDWYFDQWLHNTVTVDYALGEIEKNKQPNGGWKTTVEIERKEKGIMPVEVELNTADGEKLTKRWNGKAEKGTVIFETDSAPENVVLDPNDQILDKNRLNNDNWKIEVLPDSPFAYNYRPRNAYLVKYAPKMWYNDVDGLWFGLRFRGSYLGKFKRTEIGFTYGVKSTEVGYNFSFGHPLLPNNDKLQFELSGVKQEGRAIGELALIFRAQRMRSLPPFHKIKLALSGAQLLEDGEKYTKRKIDIGDEIISIPEWESGKVNKVSLSYNLELEKSNWGSQFGLNLESAHDIIGSNFDYSKAAGELKFNYGSFLNHLELRFFGGRFFGDEFPLQEQFFIDAANPRARFEKFYVRSVNALPPQINYHQPGGGNLRGYYAQPIASSEMAAFNAEFETSILRHFLGWLLPRRSHLGLTLFYDQARVLTEENNYQNLSDAGVGLNYGIRMFYNWFRIHVDFPIWVSDPLPDEDNVKFRWVFRLSSTL